MKEEGYVLGNEGEKVLPNWTALEAKLADADAFNKLRESPELRIIFDEPPRRQVKSGESWKWSEPCPVNNIQQFCTAVRQIRNNLFHGGKAGANPRDDDLCAAAVCALLALLEFDGSLKARFQGLY